MRSILYNHVMKGVFYITNKKRFNIVKGKQKLCLQVYGACSILHWEIIMQDYTEWGLYARGPILCAH